MNNATCYVMIQRFGKQKNIVYRKMHDSFELRNEGGGK